MENLAEYRVICRDELLDLEEAVTELMKKDWWRPHGNLQYSERFGMWIQPMVRVFVI